jgi:uncharacterized membrane protein
MSHPVEVREAFTILRSPEELYAFWRRLENLPRFMHHIESIEVIDETHSHWRVKAPGGKSVEWTAEIVRDEPGRAISWRTTSHPDIAHGGTVSFEPATGGRGTVVSVHLGYDAPGGKLGAGIAKLFGEEPRIQVREDLRRFKRLLETGEIPTIEGQTSGRMKDRARETKPESASEKPARPGREGRRGPQPVAS